MDEEEKKKFGEKQETKSWTGRPDWSIFHPLIGRLFRLGIF
jgi:hypothetical protein